jgi:hypothetical protein
MIFIFGVGGLLVWSRVWCMCFAYCVCMSVLRGEGNDVTLMLCVCVYVRSVTGLC